MFLSLHHNFASSPRPSLLIRHQSSLTPSATLIMASRRSDNAGPKTFLQRTSGVNRMAPSAPVFVPTKTPAERVIGSNVSSPQTHQQPAPTINHPQVAESLETRFDVHPQPRQQTGSTVSDWANFGVDSALARAPYRSAASVQQPVELTHGSTESPTHVSNLRHCFTFCANPFNLGGSVCHQTVYVLPH